jgi:hypothetical protein
MQNALLSSESMLAQTSNLPQMPNDWLSETAVPDLLWVANVHAAYAAVLRKVPDIFAWEESTAQIAGVKMLAQSVAFSRLRSCFDHIGRHNDGLLRSMRNLFDRLPLRSKLRFATAPETFFRITHLYKHPVESTVFLCNALNAEAAYCGLGPWKAGYSTALGDFYAAAPVNGTDEDSAPVKVVSAPHLANTIPIDFASPNTNGVQQTKVHKDYLQYSKEEEALVCDRINEVFELIQRTNPAAAGLIKEFVKVIIPLKPASGHGSTSQSRVPGRVILSGLERSGMASLASAMVHESMHQFLYILEQSGTFIVRNPDANAAKAKSLWTGRDLPLHSFIHACFIWYGLANFWLQAQSRSTFDRREVQEELHRSSSGFRQGNPTDTLAACAGMVRYDVLKIASGLKLRLQPALAADM